MNLGNLIGGLCREEVGGEWGVTVMNCGKCERR